LNKPVEDWEVELALHKSHLGRAPGPDGLRIEFFKEAYVSVPTGRGRDRRDYILLPVLHALLGSVFSSGHYPAAWSAAALAAVYKKCKSSGDMGKLLLESLGSRPYKACLFQHPSSNWKLISH
jgi:hypothetical protein